MLTVYQLTPFCRQQIPGCVKVSSIIKTQRKVWLLCLCNLIICNINEECTWNVYLVWQSEAARVGLGGREIRATTRCGGVLISVKTNTALPPKLQQDTTLFLTHNNTPHQLPPRYFAVQIFSSVHSSYYAPLSSSLLWIFILSWFLALKVSCTSYSQGYCLKSG